MVSVVFTREGAQILELSVESTGQVTSQGDSSWVDYTYRPVSPTRGRPIKFQEDPEEWLRALAAQYRTPTLNAQITRDTTPPDASGGRRIIPGLISFKTALMISSAYQVIVTLVTLIVVFILGILFIASGANDLALRPDDIGLIVFLIAVIGGFIASLWLLRTLARVIAQSELSWMNAFWALIITGFVGRALDKLLVSLLEQGPQGATGSDIVLEIIIGVIIMSLFMARFLPHLIHDSEEKKYKKEQQS